MDTKRMLGIFIGIVVILILGFGITIYVIFNPSQKDNVKNNEKVEVVVIHSDSPYITNLKDSNSYLKVDISIEVKDSKDAELLKDDMYKVRDKIIKILRNVSEDDMKQSDIQEKLKIQIKQELQKDLKIDTINGIYFNEFVVQ
ncbi:MAG: flagellar basal body-associated FliL family protein [Clostridiales bacterium]|nr:flagellar basal body-associated FliL family protein [Clostridiales bacterium]